MRFHLHLTPNTKPVPFDHLHFLTGALHKWLGRNEAHDATSLYSFSWLHGGRREDDYLTFPSGAKWTVSFYDPALAKALLSGILEKPEVFAGMRVVEVHEQTIPDFAETFRFETAGSPVVVRQAREDGTKEYLRFGQDAADEALTRVLRHKLTLAGFEGDHLHTTARFDRAYPQARTKVGTIKGISHKGSVCPVVVEGTPEAVRFAFLVGAGELTGSGFGALRLA